LEGGFNAEHFRGKKEIGAVQEIRDASGSMG